ncbi:MAG: SDR family oxidoreductase [Chthoniobacteraceae bacterium]|nr:SDR family oxidoreductase [Chthoniobacteraceae bacterium]
MNLLDQCNVLITGASSGLGKEFARQLAPRAATLVLVARRLERLEALKSELERPGLTIHCRQADLSDRTEVDTLLAWLASAGIPLNFLINNAGLGDHGRFETGEWERTRQMLDVNIGALTRLTHALLPILKAQAGAAILNVSSSAAFFPIPKLAVYAATKAYVSSFTEAIRAELRGTGVRVTAVCPGPVSTEFGRVAERTASPEPLEAPDALRVSAREVVGDALRAVEADRARVIPGWLVALTVAAASLLPMALLRYGLNKRAR